MRWGDLDDAGADRTVSPSLSRALRTSFGAHVDDLLLFLGANVVLLLAAMAVGVARSYALPLLVLAPLLALPVAAVMRLGVVVARDGSPRWAIIRAELPRRAVRKLVLATAQLVVLSIGVVNVTLAPAIGGFPGALVAAVGAYGFIASMLYAVALWPIVCDPVRDGPLRRQLRIALGVVLARPLQLGVLLLLSALSAAVSAVLFVPAIVLPSLMLVAIGAYVVPAVDEMLPLASAVD